jgi:hypothetical protein
MKALGQSPYYYLHKEKLIKQPALYAAILNLKRIFMNCTHKHTVFGDEVLPQEGKGFYTFLLYVFARK